MSNPKRVIIVGSGGHAKVILDILLGGDFKVAGFMSDDPSCRELLGCRYQGPDESLPDVVAQGITHAFVALGGNRLRKTKSESLKSLGLKLVNAISPHATLSANASMGIGVALMP